MIFVGLKLWLRLTPFAGCSDLSDRSMKIECLLMSFQSKLQSTMYLAEVGFRLDRPPDKAAWPVDCSTPDRALFCLAFGLKLMSFADLQISDQVSLKKINCTKFEATTAWLTQLFTSCLLPSWGTTWPRHQIYWPPNKAVRLWSGLPSTWQDRNNNAIQLLP